MTKNPFTPCSKKSLLAVKKALRAIKETNVEKCTGGYRLRIVAEKAATKKNYTSIYCYFCELTNSDCNVCPLSKIENKACVNSKYYDLLGDATTKAEKKELMNIIRPFIPKLIRAMKYKRINIPKWLESF